MKNRSGEATRKHIVEHSAQLLNASGYLRTPVSDIMQATGLQKGGIYNHFESRDALARAAFDYAVDRMVARFTEAMAGQASAVDRLRGLIRVFRNLPLDEVLRSGCPIANMAVESDDADPPLRDAARQAMGRLLGLFEKVVAEGMRAGEIAPGDARIKAVQLVAALEGGLLLTNLFKDGEYLRQVADQLEASLQARAGQR